MPADGFVADQRVGLLRQKSGVVGVKGDDGLGISGVVGLGKGGELGDDGVVLGGGG